MCDRFAPVHNGAALPAGWIGQIDVATGHPFFVDTATGISHWSLPPAFAMTAITAPAGIPGLPATGWATALSGEHFSYAEGPNARSARLQR